MVDDRCLSHDSLPHECDHCLETPGTGNMFDWENDEFLSSWDKTYVSTNVNPGDTPFDINTFATLLDQLNQAAPEISSISSCIIVSGSSPYYQLYKVVYDILDYRPFPAVRLVVQTLLVECSIM